MDQMDVFSSESRKRLIPYVRFGCFRFGNEKGGKLSHARDLQIRTLKRWNPVFLADFEKSVSVNTETPS